MDFHRVDMLTVLSFCYGLTVIMSALLNGETISLTLLLKAMLYFAMYIIGQGIAIRCDFLCESQEKNLFYCWIAISLGFFTRFIIDVSMPDNWYVLTHYFARDLGTDIWSEGTVPTTILAGWCIPLACILYYIFSTKVGKIKIIYFIIAIVATVISIISGTRTFIGVFGLTFLIIYFLEVFVLKRRKTKRITAFLLVMASLIVIAFSMNIGGVTTWLLKTSMFDRIVNGSLQNGLLSDNGRSSSIQFMFSNLDKVLLGGEYCRNNGALQHNWFFQSLDMYGIIPFILLVIMICMTIRAIIKMVRNNFTTPSFQILCLNIMLSLLCYSFIEPVITSNNVIMSTYFILFGIVNYVNTHKGRGEQFDYENNRTY